MASVVLKAVSEIGKFFNQMPPRGLSNHNNDKKVSRVALPIVTNWPNAVELLPLGSLRPPEPIARSVQCDAAQTVPHQSATPALSEIGPQKIEDPLSSQPIAIVQKTSDEYPDLTWPAGTIYQECLSFKGSSFPQRREPPIEG